MSKNLEWISSYDAEEFWATAYCTYRHCVVVVFGSVPLDQPGEWVCSFTMPSGVRGTIGYAPLVFNMYGACNYFEGKITQAIDRMAERAESATV